MFNTMTHFRHDCPLLRFNEGSSADAVANSKFCSRCICFVCDKPAQECTNWFDGGMGFHLCHDGRNGEGSRESDAKKLLTPHNNHCNATNIGPTAAMWSNLRRAINDYGLSPKLGMTICQAFSSMKNGNACTGDDIVCEVCSKSDEANSLLKQCSQCNWSLFCSRG